MVTRAALVLALLWGNVGQLAAEEASVADSVRKYRFLAKTARDKEDHAAAAAYYGQYLRYVPDDVLAYYRLGQAQIHLRNPEAAKAALLEALRRDSTHVNCSLLLYSVYAGGGVADSAALCLERVVAAKPDDAEKRRVLADLYRREARSQDAIRHYLQLAEQLAEPQDVVEMLALLYEDAGNAEMALTWRRKLLAGADSAAAGTTGQLSTLETMLRLQLETGDVTSAVATLEELARVDSLNRYSYFSRIAQLAEEKGDGALRARAWEGMVRANQRDLETIASLVEYHLNRRGLDAAAEWVRRGLRVDASDAHLQLLHGDLLALRGDEDGAVAAFERAKTSPRWEVVAQQRIWQIRPPQTDEERLRKAFFGGQEGEQAEEGN